MRPPAGWDIGGDDAAGLTRRGALSAAAATGLAALVAPAGASARVAQRWVGTLGLRELVLRIGVPFELVGLQWARPAAARIELRTRSAGGAWGPWVLASATGHDGDGDGDGVGDGPGRGRSAPGAFGEPVWVGRATEVALRATGPVDGVRVHLVNAATGGRASFAADVATLPTVGPALPDGPGQPPIVARSAWAGARQPAAGPYYGAVELAIVHHTENPNGYSPGEVPAMLLAIYDYHRYVRGFFDIAYNFIVDAFGRIWEARAGGVSAPVIGAHAGGFNTVSTGVAVLGTFDDAVPSPAALDALQRLLAWKLALHGVPAQGAVDVRVDPAGAVYTHFAPNQRVSLPRIAGHRQADETDCPGTAFFERLPSIRPRVAGLQRTPAKLSIEPSSGLSVDPGVPVTLSGRLADGDGAALASAPVLVQSLPGSVTVATVTTDLDGRWTVSLTPRRSLVLRALHALAPATSSDVVLVSVVPVLTLRAVGPARVAGTITPGRAAVMLDVYHGRTLVSSRRVAVHGGRFAAPVRFGTVRHGTFVAIARYAGGAAYGPASSPAVRFNR